MLMKLIKSEIKKIFKIKMNIVLMIIAILGTGCIIGLRYSDFGTIQVIENTQGESLHGVELLRYIDNIRHQYAGEWTEEKAKQYEQDFKMLFEKYDKKALDENFMKKEYGNKYQELVNMFYDNELTVQKYLKFMKENNSSNSITAYDGDINSQELWNLEIHYKDDPISQGIEQAYADGFSGRNKEIKFMSLTTQLLVDKKLNFDEDKNEINTYLSEKAKSLPATFDSHLPNTMLINSMADALWLALICIMIMLANTFSIEKQYNMEQLIYPTKASSFKITIAKILAGTLLAFGVMLLCILSCLVVANILLPVHIWDIAYYTIEGSNPFISAFTLKNMLVYSIALSLMSSLATACIVLILSYISKNRFVTIILSFLYFGYIIFFNVTGYMRMLHPYIMTHINEYYWNIQSYVIINGDIIPYRILVLVIWSIIISAVFCGMILRSKSKSSRTV